MVIVDSALTPATFWVKLDDLDFTAGAEVKKLELAAGKTYSGNAKDKCADAKLFTFQGPDGRSASELTLTVGKLGLARDRSVDLVLTASIFRA